MRFVVYGVLGEKEGMHYYIEMKKHKNLISTETKSSQRLKGREEKHTRLLWTLVWVKGTLLMEADYLSSCIV